MRKNLQFIFLLSAIVLLFSAVSFGQDKRPTSNASSKYVISAEAGGVNFVEGKVMVSRQDETSGYLLKGDEVDIGDVVETGSDGKTEILLNPGSYARLGENTSFEFIDNSLDNLQLKLNSGSAILEVLTTNDFSFVVKTPKAEFNVVKSGVYRIDVLGDGTGKIEVWKGRAQVGDDENGRVKKGRTATVDGDDVTVAKFDRGDRDEFEEWSKARSKQLAKANSNFQRRNLRDRLITSFNMNRWNMYDSFGVWVYDPFWGAYTFLPFGYGWASPYGYRYRRDLWYCRLPRYIYYSPPPARRTIITGTNTNNRRRDLGANRSINDRQNRTNRGTRRTSPPVNRTQRTTPPARRIDRQNRRIRPANQSPGPATNRRVRPATRPIAVPRRSTKLIVRSQKSKKGN